MDQPITSGKAEHLKTGNIYDVVGEAIDATNARDGQVVVVYTRNGRLFVRDKAEFLAKFRIMVPHELFGIGA